MLSYFTPKRYFRASLKSFLPFVGRGCELLTLILTSVRYSGTVQSDKFLSLNNPRSLPDFIGPLAVSAQSPAVGFIVFIVVIFLGPFCAFRRLTLCEAHNTGNYVLYSNCVGSSTFPADYVTLKMKIEDAGDGAYGL